MTTQELKIKCLELAVSLITPGSAFMNSTPAKFVVAQADEFYEFLKS